MKHRLGGRCRGRVPFAGRAAHAARSSGSALRRRSASAATASAARETPRNSRSYAVKRIELSDLDAQPLDLALHPAQLRAARESGVMPDLIRFVSLDTGHLPIMPTLDAVDRETQRFRRVFQPVLHKALGGAPDRVLDQPARAPVN